MAGMILERGLIWEDGAVSFMARIVKQDGTNAAQADFTGATYSIHEKSSGTQVVASTAMTISSVIFDALQTDSRWTKDATGYNFRLDISDGVFTSGATVYRVECLFDPTDGGDFWVVFEPKTVEIKRT